MTKEKCCEKNKLYYHRMILFSVLCNTYKNRSWKSRKHADGTMEEGYFIVGMRTDRGQFTYHYKEEYWDKFEVKELYKAPEWDGHTSEDILRLESIISLK